MEQILISLYLANKSTKYSMSVAAITRKNIDVAFYEMNYREKLRSISRFEVFCCNWINLNREFNKMNFSTLTRMKLKL
jgi:hypothetical protein